MTYLKLTILIAFIFAMFWYFFLPVRSVEVTVSESIPITQKLLQENIGNDSTDRLSASASKFEGSVDMPREVYQRLLAKARMKADTLAACVHYKAGDLLSVRETSTDEFLSKGWTAYPPLSALGNASGDSILLGYTKVTFLCSFRLK